MVEEIQELVHYTTDEEMNRHGYPARVEDKHESSRGNIRKGTRAEAIVSTGNDAYVENSRKQTRNKQSHPLRQNQRKWKRKPVVEEHRTDEED